MMSSLPAEVIYRILDNLPHTTVGAQALSRCCMTGHSLLRGAALDPEVWKKFYEARYKHADSSQEKKRAESLAGNWRLMYVARRRVDNNAIECLKGIEKATVSHDRTELARAIVIFGFDVWDTLTEESLRPLPPLLQTESDVEKIANGTSLTNLTRRYWAIELLNVILRRSAITLWDELFFTFTPKLFTFEDVFATLSSFHGVCPEQVRSCVKRECTS